MGTLNAEVTPQTTRQSAGQDSRLYGGQDACRYAKTNTTPKQVTSPNGRPPSGGASVPEEWEPPFCNVFPLRDSADGTDNRPADGWVRAHRRAKQCVPALSRGQPPARPKGGLGCRDASVNPRAAWPP